MSLLWLAGPVSAGQNTLALMESEFKSIVASVHPCVVKVIATCNVTLGRIPPLQGELVVGERSVDHCYQNVGSGTIINRQGHIVTTAAVVQNATTIEVVFADGQALEGKLLGLDAPTDLAVIAIEGGELPAVKIGDSGNISMGSWVVAIGRSYGQSPTVSFGFVNGMEALPDRPFYDAMMVNARVNPGNSGGVIVNMAGEAVGLIAATLAEPDFSQYSTLPQPLKDQPALWQATIQQERIWKGGDISFAIPMNTVVNIADQLAKKGKVARGWLGLRPVEQFDTQAKENGVRVQEVFDNSPAHQAGIQADDLIFEFNGQPIRTFLDLKRVVANTLPKTRVLVKVQRGKKTQHLNVTLGEMQ